MISRILFILSLALITLSTQAQGLKNIDSLIAATTNSSDFLEKAKIANLIADQLNGSQSYGVALEYARSAEEFIGGNKSKEAIGVLAEAKHHQGRSLTQIGDYSGALQAILDGEALYNQLLETETSQTIIKQIKRKLADSFNDRGLVHLRQKNYAKAEDNYFRALQILAALKDKKGIADSYNNTGKLLFTGGNIDSALVYYNKSLNLRLEIGDKKGVSGSYNNIGLCYQVLGSIHQANGQYGKSKTEIYNALDYFKKSLELTKEIGNKFEIAGTSINLGRFYIQFEMYDEAQIYIQEGIRYSKEIGASARLKDAYETMAFMYEDLDNPQKALEYYKLYKSASDSLTIFQKQQELEMLEAQSEFEKQSIEDRNRQNREKELLEEKNAKNQLIIWFTVGGLVVVISLSFFLFSRFRVISKQKSLIEDQNKALEGANREINKQNKKITDSINYAKTIQNAILQSKNKIGLGEHFIFFKPRDVVSGDFYWSHTSPDGNKVIWTAADCTGHGVPGALMSMIGTSLLNEIVIEKGLTSADKILNELRVLLIKTFGQTQSSISKDGMDLALCVWDKAKQELQFSGANNPLYLIRKGIADSGFTAKGRVRFHENDLAEIRGDKQSISFEEGKTGIFTRNTIKLQKDDILITFSDGYPDQFGGPDQKKFTYPRFKDLLIQIQKETLGTQAQIIESTYKEWMGTEDQIDDVCVFGVKI